MENIEEALRDRIRRLRKEANLTIAGLAKASNVSDQTIKDIEAGRRGVGVDALIGLSRVFNLSMEALLFGEDVSGSSLKKEVEPVSIFAKKVMAIPDHVYDLAQNFTPEHPVWKTVEAILESRRKDLEKERAGKVKKA